MTRRGFTLTSTAIAAGLLGVLLLVGMGIFVFGQRRAGQGNAEADLQQQAMAVAYRITQEVADAREVLIPLRAGRKYPFLGLRTLEQEIVLYSFHKGAARILRQVVDPVTWKPSEEKVVCLDVDGAAFSVSRQGQYVHMDLTLGRKLGDRRVTLPLVTGTGVRGW